MWRSKIMINLCMSLLKSWVSSLHSKPYRSHHETVAVCRHVAWHPSWGRTTNTHALFFSFALSAVRVCHSLSWSKCTARHLQLPRLIFHLHQSQHPSPKLILKSVSFHPHINSCFLLASSNVSKSPKPSKQTHLSDDAGYTVHTDFKCEPHCLIILWNVARVCVQVLENDSKEESSS